MIDLRTLLITRLVQLIPVLLSLGFHEWAHAWSAQRLGDDTATRLGRNTMNPFAHVDLVGTFILPLLGIPFGWAKPVPVSPIRFRRDVSMGMGILIVAAAGPASNVVLGAICTGLLWAEGTFVGPAWTGGAGLFVLLESMVVINALLAIFNLLPIPPLDGGRIADALMPREWRPAWDAFTRVGPILLVAVLVLPIVNGRTLLSVPVEWIQQMLVAIR